MAGGIVEWLLRVKDDNASSNVTTLGNAADDAAKKTTKLGDAHEEAAKKAGKFGEASSKARGALDALDPRLGSIAGGANDAADAFEVLSSAGLSATAVMGPIAVVAGALAAVYLVLAADAAAAAEKVDAAAAAAKTWADTAKPLKITLDDLSDTLAVATGTMTETEKSTRDQTRTLEAQAGAVRALMVAHVDETAENAKGTKLTVDSAAAYKYAKEQLVIYDQRIADAKDNIVLLGAAKQRGIDADKAAAAAAKAAAEAAKKAAAEAKVEAEAKRVAAEAAAALAKQMAADEKEIRASQAQQAKDRKMEADFIAVQDKAEIDAIMKKVEIEQDLAKARLDSAATAAGMATGGPSAVMGAVSSAGPWGAIIAAIVELVGNFADIGDEFNDFTLNFQESLSKLPETLGDNIGHWLETAIQSVDVGANFIQSLADNLDNIISGILGSIGPLLASLLETAFIGLPQALLSLVATLFTADFWIKIGESFVQGFKDAFKGTKADTTGTEVSAIHSGTHSRGEAFVSYDTGTDYITSTGLKLMHEGERVINTAGTSSGRTAMMMGGGSAPMVVLPPGLIIGTPETVAREVGRATSRGVAL